jgi:hypothetical protein
MSATRGMTDMGPKRDTMETRTKRSIRTTRAMRDYKENDSSEDVSDEEKR